LPGLKPLELHGVVCGFPRSGTTLMQMMLQFAFPAAKGFRGEFDGWRAATCCWRNSAQMFSKVPEDLFRLCELRAIYAGRRARLRAIVLLRDPRDVLTSFHAAQPQRQYFLSAAQWLRYYEAFRRERDRADVLTVRYEDLADGPDAVQARVEYFLGRAAERPFSEFHTADWSAFDTRPLNGLRPLGCEKVGRWRDPAHFHRIGEIIEQLPRLPDYLVDLGYEATIDWFRAWQAREQSAPETAAPRSGANS
jgi:hypothetical protein